jgi:hypothetical protein
LSKKKREETADYEEPDEVEAASAQRGKLKAKRVVSPENEQAEESEVKKGKRKAVQSDDEEAVVRYSRIAKRSAPNKKVKIESEFFENEFDKTENLKPR